MTRSTWIKVGATGAVVAVATGIILYTASQSSGMFRFVDEVKAQSAELRGKDLWVAGTLEPGTHQVRTVRGQRQEHQFVMSHRGEQLQVHYVGVMPANVKPGLQLVVRGKLVKVGLFEATEIRIKCPSKYKGAYQARK